MPGATDGGAGWAALVLTIVAQILLALRFGFVGVLLTLPMTIVIVTLVKTLWVEDVLGDTATEPADVGRTSRHDLLDR